MNTLLKAVIVVIIVVSAVTASGQDHSYAVKWVGALRNVMSGDLNRQVALGTLSALPHLHAVGVLEQLKGEVSIFDGVPSIAQVKDGKAMITTSFSHSAAFLVYAQVERCQEVPSSVPIGTPAELEKFILTAALDRHIDVSRPSPFLIRTEMARANFHIEDKRDNLPHTPELHKSAQVPFTLTDEPIEVIGSYSDKHHGVFTHHGENTHMHIKSSDNRVSGHRDAIEIRPPAVLYLPA